MQDSLLFFSGWLDSAGADSFIRRLLISLASYSPSTKTRASGALGTRLYGSRARYRAKMEIHHDYASILDYSQEYYSELHLCTPGVIFIITALHNRHHTATNNINFVHNHTASFSGSTSLLLKNKQQKRAGKWSLGTRLYSYYTNEKVGASNLQSFISTTTTSFSLRFNTSWSAFRACSLPSSFSVKSPVMCSPEQPHFLVLQTTREL